ncbi:MAG TPA: hypothetical protein VFA25_06270, partial [Actinomycetota bacterium]|nr:hypothetical protein [Actinomycetota bacterium]
AARVVLGTVALGLVLLLVAVVRSWNEFDPSNPVRFVYVIGLAGTLAAIGILTVQTRRTIQAGRRPS